MLWVGLLALAALCSFVSATVLSRNNPDEPIPLVRTPTVVPIGQVGFLAAACVTGWLGASYAADTALGGWAFPLGALAVGVPWFLVRHRHNEAVG